MNITLKQKIAALPEVPGVYLYKDSKGRIIYVGKAKSLKKRVSSYFNRFLCAKTQRLVAKISDIEYIVTPSEVQAQLLEAALIKDKQPFYNISLKDDKSFPLVKITEENFPIISICRKRDIVRYSTLRHSEGAHACRQGRKRPKNPKTFRSFASLRMTGNESCKAQYFGPYINAQSLRESLKVIRRIFGFRSCQKLPKQACLYFRLKLCPAPCTGKIDSKSYKELIEQIKLFLGSEYEKLLVRLTTKMQAAAKSHDFEEAARIRDQINVLSVFSQGRIHSIGLNELEELKNLLKLPKFPERIEGFDISNISGQEASGAMVSFYKGLPDKDNYRRFRIKLTKGVDDYGMLREVVFRRYSRLKNESLALPDLILIDGGKGHLLTAFEVVKGLGLGIPMMSIAKEQEHLYILGRNKPIKLPQDTPALNLIRRIRDEAHRFAVSYHHVLRRKKIIGK